MAGEQIWGKVQGSMCKNSSISWEMGTVQDVGHVDQSYILLLPTSTTQTYSAWECKHLRAVIQSRPYYLQRLSHQPDSTLGRNAGLAPHSPPLSEAHSSFASKMMPCWTAPRKTSSGMHTHTHTQTRFFQLNAWLSFPEHNVKTVNLSGLVLTMTITPIP